MDTCLDVLAEERTTTNPVADDMDACKELYEMTMEIVGKKDPRCSQARYASMNVTVTNFGQVLPCDPCPGCLLIVTVHFEFRCFELG